MRERVEQPLNANERFLYAIAIRLDAVIDILSSFTEVYGKENGMAVTDNTVKEVVQEVKEIQEDVVKVARKPRTKKEV